MTCEVTLKGKVLPIGGLKEKTMAAYRAGVKTVIIPSENESDLKDIDESVKKTLRFVMADTLDTVFTHALEKNRKIIPLH
jgi:ATP-dependent Lon protease